MREVFSAVVVIGLVLVAVFVPVAFFGGTTGRLYQQFSLTIAFAVVLSVFNAVTFTPALSALLLDRESHVHGRFFSGVNRVIEAGTAFYVQSLRRALALRPLMLALFVLGLLGAWGLFRIVPIRVRAGRGRGLLHHRRPGAAGGVARLHDRDLQAGGGRAVRRPRHHGRPSRWRASASAAGRRTTG